MSKQTEYEERLMLTKEQFDSLTEYISSKANLTKISQANYYFDNEDLWLLKNHNVLRVRCINGKKFELTLKSKGIEGDLEITDLITKKQASDLIDKNLLPNGDVRNYLKSLNNIKYIAKLQTLRTEVNFEDFLFVLDVNNYCSITDYNLEIEAPSKDKAKEVIMKYCDAFDLTYDKNYISKSRRAINEILKTKGK